RDKDPDDPPEPPEGAVTPIDSLLTTDRSQVLMGTDLPAYKTRMYAEVARRCGLPVSPQQIEAMLAELAIVEAEARVVASNGRVEFPPLRDDQRLLIKRKHLDHLVSRAVRRWANGDETRYPQGFSMINRAILERWGERGGMAERAFDE